MIRISMSRHFISTYSWAFTSRQRLHHKAFIVLVKNHGPFCWGKDPLNAVHNAVVLEEVAMMAFHTELLMPGVQAMPQALLDKHFLRKHGPNAYYGQAKKG